MIKPERPSYSELVKRAFDVVASFVGLIFLAPLFLIVAFLIKLESSGPVFFRQERIGRGFRSFQIIKFRTMYYTPQSRSFTDANNSSKITKMGNLLRRAKIDELPQLINVLKGEMSLVGPRPELPEYVHMFRSKYLRILKVRPGITDPASLEFRNEEEILRRAMNPEEEYVKRILPEKIRLTLRYLKESSFSNDLGMIFKTLLRMDSTARLKGDVFMLRRQGMVFFFIDTVLGFLSFHLAYFLRYDWTDLPPEAMGTYLSLLPFIFISRSLAYFFFGFYTRFWEYSSLDDLLLIIKAALVGSFLLIFSVFLYSNPPITFPRSVPMIDFVLLVMMLGGTRMVWRLWNERQKQKHTDEEGGIEEGGIKVLIMGAGDTGALLLKNLRTRGFRYHVCGFIDDNPDVRHNTLMGIKVLGNRHSIPKLVRNLGIKEVLIAVDNISSDSLSEVVDLCRQSVVNYKMVSSVVDIPTNEVHFSKIRQIEISDLLGRDTVSLNLSSIRKMIWGKRVLVTGAGGSIGSELCQQILEYEPSDLIMLDRGENYLYELDVALNSEANVISKRHYLFCSITNKEKMDSIFAEHRPQLVFHAAAHKHVPLMEENVDEAVVNNVYGTKLTADVSDKYGVDIFVMVSTDKVVRPTSVMGTTKKIAEKYIQYINRRSQTRFMTVRFGNVLGSKGSVIPFFQSQIENGGPVTVTHPEMTRYFMLIPEAVQLILQAAVIGTGGEIFILEMGKPVKIMDLARKMIKLAGYEPDKDIEIKITGIRPGEKLYEELVDGGDETVQTFHRKIKTLKSIRNIDGDFNSKVEELFRVAVEGDSMQIRVMMQRLIGEDYPTSITSDQRLAHVGKEP